MKKELLIYITLFLILAIAQHPDLLSSPLERLSQLPTAGAYGVGFVHPIVFSLIAYLLLWIFRGIFRVIKSFFKK